MKVNISLGIKPNELAELIKSMGMPPVVGQLDTPSMLDAFMEQAAGENADESNPCATADDAQSATDKASDDTESVGETAINNRGKKILAEDCDRDAADQDEDPTNGEPAHDGLCMSTVKIYYPDTGKDVTTHKTFDPVTGELISCRTDTRFPDGKTIMEEKVYA